MKYQFLAKVNTILDTKRLNLTIFNLVYFIQRNKLEKEQTGFQKKVTSKHFTKYFMWTLKQKECHFLYLHF